jgi:phytoene/squalene synthetase
MPEATKPLLTNLLRDTSRSFYLTLRVLPAAVRPQNSFFPACFLSESI